MKKSTLDPTPVSILLGKAMTGDTDNRKVFMKGIDSSYYYEEED